MHRSQAPSPHGPESGTSCIAGRALDIAVASSALVMLAPLMVLVALAISLESGRPILFSQLRLGQGM